MLHVGKKKSSALLWYLQATADLGLTGTKHKQAELIQVPGDAQSLSVKQGQSLHGCSTPLSKRKQNPG